MKKPSEIVEIKGVDPGLIKNIQMPPEAKIAQQINELDPKIRYKLLLAEDQAQKQGDHRSILDPNKYFSLLLQVDPKYMERLQQQVQSLMRDMPTLRDAATAASGNPEKLADIILTLCGISDRKDFLGGDLQAQYPNLNKPSLIKLGANNLYAMIMSYLETLNDHSDNRTALAKFEKLMKTRMEGSAPRQNSNLEPPK